MHAGIIHEFIEYINNQNISGFCLVIAENITFIDSHGNKIIGKDNFCKAFEAYFQIFPSYKIIAEKIITEKNTFAIFGTASANTTKTEAGFLWSIPAAWKAEISENKISLWQVFADSKIPLDSLKHNLSTI